MVYAHWVPHHRDHDDELMGYLVPHGELVVPTTLVGMPLGAAQPRASAEEMLNSRGLAALNEKFWALLPSPVTAGIDIEAPLAHWVWRQVVLVESSPAGASIRPAFAYPEELNALVRVPVPVGDLLRTTQP
ncbi:MAG: hypothetical protein JWP85_1174 [Rhodoglobus sp.]|nr:hypothetical protein [Rhodoglobus sp.]